jgi:PKD repeat protein
MIYYRMIKLYSRLQATLLFTLISLASLSQCETCEIDYSCTSSDGFPVICPDNLPDATAGVFYETSATFYMPASVTDPGSGIQATLESVTITSVSGLPYGIEVTSNNANSTYYPSDGEEYGCVNICGTPLIAGEYYISISVSVIAMAFGFEQTINESFSIPFTVIEGEGGGNASFSTSVTSGCAPLDVQITNSITGPGTSYAWDLIGFGSGTALTMNLLTDSYGLETTWTVTDESGSLVMTGGPYDGAQTNYSESLCVGNGCYTLNVFDSYGDGMQYGGVIGSYSLIDSDGNILAQIVDGGDFGGQATHSFCISSDTPSVCNPTSANPLITFTEPGEYTVSLVTTVMELTLTGLNITTLSGGWSGDVEEFFGGAPDPYFVLTGGEIDYVSNWVGNTEAPNFTGLSIPLEYGTQYSFSFYDEDDISNNDYLGTATFTPSSGGEFMINGGGNTAIITIVETASAIFEDSETIVVYESLDGFADLDGDGFGDLNMPINGCDPDLATPFSFNGEDCDDQNANVYPGAEGTFSNIDNDCNEIIEEDELPAVEGCMILDACNYNPEANTEDDSCEYESCMGCTDPVAINYNPAATISNNEICEYAECFGDFDNDGAITVNDLLTLLTHFGCELDCPTDLTGDDLVSVADLLEMLVVFGSLCE